MDNEAGLTVHGSQDVAHFRRCACTDFKVGTCPFIYVDTVVAMVPHCEAYETGRPDFIKGAAVGTVFGSTVDCCAYGSVIIPFCKIVREMKLIPA